MPSRDLDEGGFSRGSRTVPIEDVPKQAPQTRNETRSVAAALSHPLVSPLKLPNHLRLQSAEAPNLHP